MASPAGLAIVAYVFFGFVFVYVGLWIIVVFTRDVREPESAVTMVPFLGPLVGMIRGGVGFFVDQRDKYNHPIYTLRLPFQRIYVINATELIPALQKQWRLVTFAPLFAGAGKVVGMSQEACDLMHEDLADETKNFNYTWMSLVMPHLALGSAGLDEMNRRAGEVVAGEVDALVKKVRQGMTMAGEGGDVVVLQEWILKVMVLASTDAVYGDLNPFRDSAVAKAWDTVEMNFLTLVLTPLPRIISDIFTRKVVQARELVISAFLDFFQKGGTTTASTLLKVKHAHHREKLINDRDIACTDLALCFAILGNTKPTAWWLVYHIFSDERVLGDIRRELLSVPGLICETETEIGDGNGGVCAPVQVDLSKIRAQECPILYSTLLETLRYRAVSNSVRKVIEQDVVLDGRFLLKKGSLVMLPHTVQHSSSKAFGEDVKEFDHLRFVRQSPGNRDKQQQKRGSGGVLDRRAFYAFGGGHGMCPGRHFASLEIMALAALMVLRFDITPVVGKEQQDGENWKSEKWTEPTCENSPLASGVPYPDEEIYVRIRVRDSLGSGKDGDGENLNGNRSVKNVTKWKVSYSSSGSVSSDRAGEDDGSKEAQDVDVLEGNW